MQPNTDFEKAWFAAKTLAEKFQKGIGHYCSGEYQEAEVRKDFIDKFFIALGWDVNHDVQHDPYRREVRIEAPSRKAKGRADYSFAVAPHYKRVRFFVEAKRPQPNIASPDNCFQAIRYSWPKGIAVAVLTDFKSVHVLDSRFRPNINSATSRVVRSWGHLDFHDKEAFSEIYYLLSREAVANGSLELFASNELPEEQLAAKQYTLFASEARAFDDDFLDKLDQWRDRLASFFKKANKSLTGEQLTECVQRTLDRLIFIRFLEDKGIEPNPIIQNFGSRSASHWLDFVSTSKRLDHVYNGVVFKPHSIVDDPSFAPSGVSFAEICDELTDEHSPYNFDSIPVEILGRIYERFLGKVVHASRTGVEIVQKENVRKAGGVYYTPDYIVAYMVEQALGAQVRTKKPDEILALRVIDTACGSGSFLIGAFSYLIEHLTAYWRQHTKPPKGVVEIREGQAHLTLSYKRQILIKCIYGIDIDPQAVEVAQLSLYLKLLEEETSYSASQQRQLEIGVTMLPSLTQNVVMGNSLIAPSDLPDDLYDLDHVEQAKPLNLKSTFPEVFKGGGFDLVIGNPPYIKEATNRSAFDFVRASEYYQGKMDIWYMFACRGLDLLKSDAGVLAYIATNNWVTNAGASKLRDKVTRHARIQHLIDFGDYKVFKDAGIQTMILIAARSSHPEQYEFDYRRLDHKKPTLAHARSLLDGSITEDCQILKPTFVRARPAGAPMTFSGTSAEAVLAKLAAKRNFVFDVKTEIAHGIDVLQDFVNKKSARVLGSGFKPGEGIFVLSDAERRVLELNAQEQELVRPYFTSRELKKYVGSPANSQWIIYTTSKHKPGSMSALPNLKRHLDRFAPILTSVNKPYGLHRARNERFFTGEKIFVQRKAVEPTFTYTDFDCYVSRMFISIKTDRIDQKYLVGLLNSKLVRYWLRHRGKMQGHHFQIDNAPLLDLPIFAPSQAEQVRLAKLSQRIMECRGKLNTASTDASRTHLHRLADQYERQFDDELGALYELSSEDLEIVRSS